MNLIYFNELGEEKPQLFIPLDIDRQIDGKLLPTSNHIDLSTSNGRLPISPNYLPNSSISLPPNRSQSHPNAMTTSSLHVLDGGVYQGQTSTQANHWNANAMVVLFNSQINFLFLSLKQKNTKK